MPPENLFPSSDLPEEPRHFVRGENETKKIWINPDDLSFFSYNQVNFTYKVLTWRYPMLYGMSPDKSL